MTKACSFIKFYSLKPWIWHQKRPILIQLEQKAPLFLAFTGHFACKIYQFYRFLLKSIFPCAILCSSVGRYACSLMWRYSNIAAMHCQALFLCQSPEFSGFFHFHFPNLFTHIFHPFSFQRYSLSRTSPVFLSCFTVDFSVKIQHAQNKETK